MKIILTGCNGKMGGVLTRCIDQKDGMQVVAGLDIADSNGGAYPVYADVAAVNEKADVIIDFSNPAALSKTIALAKAQ